MFNRSLLLVSAVEVFYFPRGLIIRYFARFSVSLAKARIGVIQINLGQFYC